MGAEKEHYSLTKRLEVQGKNLESVFCGDTTPTVGECVELRHYPLLPDVWLLFLFNETGCEQLENNNSSLLFDILSEGSFCGGATADTAASERLSVEVRHSELRARATPR